jgi:hypothetical protein
MTLSSWRGTVGIVRPTLRTGALEDLIRMLPKQFLSQLVPHDFSGLISRD